MNGIRRFDGARRTSRHVAEWGALRAETNVLRLDDPSRSRLHVDAHVLLGTVEGGAGDVAVSVDRGASWRGPKRAGSIGFFPADRLITSSWPAAVLTYVALFADRRATEALYEKAARGIVWEPLICADDSFSSAGVVELARAMREPHDDLAALAAESIATALYLHAVRRFSTFSFESQREREAVRRAVAVIREALPHAPNLAALVAASGLPRGRFLAAFRGELGCSPHQYVIRERLRLACSLMTSTNRTLADIALAAGFANAAHFGERFRRHMGVTPRVWRGR